MTTSRSDDPLRAAARYLLEHCGGLAPGERFLLLIDETTRGLAPRFRAAALALGSRYEEVELPLADRHGKEPTEELGSRMLQADLVAGLTRMSLAHTQARLRLCESGGRYLSLPGYTDELLAHPAVGADFRSQFRLTRAVADAFSRGSALHVTTRAGTDLRLNIAGREGNCCPGFVDAHYRFGSPPDIEANVPPVEDDSEGIAVIDGSVTSDEIGLLSEPIVLDIRGGSIVAIESGRHEYARVAAALFDRVQDTRARVLAECGVGLNPLANLTGNMLTDEGVLGSVHFGFGSNSTVGGNNVVPFHVDFVMQSASMWIDGEQVLRDGEPLLAGIDRLLASDLPGAMPGEDAQGPAARRARVRASARAAGGANTGG